MLPAQNGSMISPMSAGTVCVRELSRDGCLEVLSGKSLFEKVGVGSRGELVAKLLV